MEENTRCWQALLTFLVNRKGKNPLKHLPKLQQTFYLFMNSTFRVSVNVIYL